jgi:hypothetical protein
VQVIVVRPVLNVVVRADCLVRVRLAQEGEVVSKNRSNFIVDGTPPLGTARIHIRFEDGTTAEPDFFVTSAFVAWLGPEQLAPGRRATELVSVDANGHTIANLRLDPEQFMPR